MKNSFKATRNVINCQYKNIYCANKGLKWDFQKSLEMVNLHISFCTQPSLRVHRHSIQQMKIAFKKVWFKPESS